VKSYVDVYEVTEETQLKSSTVVPKKDEKENPMHFEYGFSTFRDFQTVVIQELPERTPTG
jgi:DNA replication licensing factor MCM3